MKLNAYQKKIFAISAVVLLGLVGLWAILNTDVFAGSPKKNNKQAYTEPYPIQPPNYPVTTGKGDNNEPSIAISTKDPMTMVAGSNDYNTPSGDAWCGFYTTHDGGKTWKEDFIPGYPGDSRSSPLSGFMGAGDPVIVADGDGNFYYSGIAFKRSRNPFNPIGFGLNLGVDNCLFVAKSTDGGDSFDQITVVWSALQSLVRFNDKEWVAVDPNNSNNVYIAWTIFTGMVTARLMFSRSTDGGKTFSTPITVSEATSGELNLQGAALVVDNDGNIHLTWMNFGTNEVRYAKSTDGGQSFSTPVDVAPVTPIPSTLDNGNYRTPTMTMLAVDRSNTNSSGALYVTWADYSNGDADIFLAYSPDNGNDWKGPVRVNNDTVGNGKDQFFPAVSVSEEGYVHVTFYDRRSDPDNTLLEYWWAVSFDGGKTFPVNLRVSNTSFNGDYSREKDNDFIGDYTSVTTQNSTLACAWCDMREADASHASSQIYAGIFDYQKLLTTNGLVPTTQNATKTA